MPPSPPPVFIFDDGRGRLAPLTDLRAAFDIRTGALTQVQRILLASRLFGTPAPSGLIVPEALAAVTRERHTLPVNDHPATGALLLVNGRAPLLHPSAVPGLECGSALVDGSSGTILLAHITADRIGCILRGDAAGLRIATSAPAEHMTRPWHIRRLRDAAITNDLHWLMSERLGVDPAAMPKSGYRSFASPSARVHPSAILDTEHGHVFIDDDATVRPGAIICGPAYIGPHSTVLDRCLIKPHTAIGPHCKVAGEVGGTIFQGFANKAHDGHLGDSYVGEWANLGAGTTNSNLLNTYGEVVCRPFEPDGRPGSNERTGEQFLGAIIGDHVKCAICTRIMTGAIIGTGAMWAASSPVSGTVPAFSWVTDAGTRPYAMNKFIEVARTVMARRKVPLSEACRARLVVLQPALSPA